MANMKRCFHILELIDSFNSINKNDVYKHFINSYNHELIKESLEYLIVQKFITISSEDSNQNIFYKSTILGQNLVKDIYCEKH